MEAFVAALVALLALTAMEIVLGIDNIVFISIISQRLPEEQQKKGRRTGLLLALVTRILLLASLFIILKLDQPFMSWTKDVGLPESWFMTEVESVHHGAEEESDEDTGEEINNETEAEQEPKYVLNRELDAVSIKDVILFLGGLFLIAKSVIEIHEQLQHHHIKKKEIKHASFTSVVFQIAILDIVFSLDSVITAAGLVESIWIMVTAVVLAMGVMIAFAEPVSKFVEQNPTIKMLALSFLILIGVMLVAEGAGAHLDKGYVYFAMAFALGVEFLNLRVAAVKSRAERFHLNEEDE